MRRRWNGDVKIKEKWFEKQNRKVEEACSKENENNESGENNDEKIKELLFKTR